MQVCTQPTHPLQMYVGHTHSNTHMNTYPTHIQCVCILDIPNTYITYIICTHSAHTYAPTEYFTYAHTLYVCISMWIFTHATLTLHIHTLVRMCVPYRCFLPSPIFLFSICYSAHFFGLFIDDLSLLNVSCMRAKLSLVSLFFIQGRSSAWHGGNIQCIRGERMKGKKNRRAVITRYHGSLRAWLRITFGRRFSRERTS